MRKIRIAVSKGRLLEGTLEAFQRASMIVPSPGQIDSRRLLIETDSAEWILIKDADVPVYVESGAADAGVVGMDQILEQEPDVFLPVEFEFGRCRMMLIARPDEPQFGSRGGRIATKYPTVTRRFLERRGLHLDIITLHGSVELAPVLGLAPFIVDLVETGRTIEAHQLEIRELIAPIAPRLIINKRFYGAESVAAQRLVRQMGTRTEAEVSI